MFYETFIVEWRVFDSICMAFCALLLCSFAGCDPVQTTNQIVQVSVHNAAGTSPMANTTVSIKSAWDPPYEDESWNTTARKQWEEFPWYESTTDDQGRASILVAITAIDGTEGDEPPPNRDVVSGRPYVIRIQNGDALEELKLIVQPAAEVKGKLYSIKVTAIEKSRYLDL